MKKILQFLEILYPTQSRHLCRVTLYMVLVQMAVMVDIDQRPGDALRDKFFELGLDGANVTVPHKESAFRACDEVDEFAKRVGAVHYSCKKRRQALSDTIQMLWDF